MRVIKTEVVDDSTGEVIARKTTYGTNNGNNWVIHYKNASEYLATHCNSSATFKVFHILISQMNDLSTGGAICSRQWLQQKLKLTRKSVYNALTWLKENDILIETTSNGVTEFFFNPDFVTIGKKKSLRRDKWENLKEIKKTKEICKVHDLPYPLPKGKTLYLLLREKYGIDAKGAVELVDIIGTQVVTMEETKKADIV